VAKAEQNIAVVEAVFDIENACEDSAVRFSRAKSCAVESLRKHQFSI
jgi:hypothetical protein